MRRGRYSLDGLEKDYRRDKLEIGFTETGEFDGDSFETSLIGICFSANSLDRDSCDRGKFDGITVHKDKFDKN